MCHNADREVNYSHDFLYNYPESVTQPEDRDLTSLRTIIALRTARAALGWTQQELANRSGVSLVTLARMESNVGSPRLKTLEALRLAMQQADVKIIDNEPFDGFTIVVGRVAAIDSVERLTRGVENRDVKAAS